MTAKVTFDPLQMQQAAAQAARLLMVLANPDRLVLMCLLSQEELSVGELGARAQINQPSLSQQLSVLRQKNLVSTRREGKQRYYRLSDPKVVQLLGTLYELYCQDTDQQSTR